MQRNKIILRSTVILLLILSCKANADEGWWTRSRIAGGSFYSPSEHPDIALEKEVLIYKGNGTCEVHFLFKNMIEKPVTVVVGFPVKIMIPLQEFYVYDPSKNILQNIYGVTVFRGLGGYERATRLDPKRVNLNIGKLVSWGGFERLNSFWESDAIVKSIAIVQDGKDVSIDSVYVEGQVAKDDTLELSFHFLHQLSFSPNDFSKVVVKYSFFNETMSSGGMLFTKYINWRYILGTGRTWKGPIKTIYFLTPDHLLPDLPKAFLRAGDFKKKTIFAAREYEPAEQDGVEISYIKFGQSGDGLHIVTLGELDTALSFVDSIETPKRPAQNFVVMKNASSYLPQRTWVNSFIVASVPQNNSIWDEIFPRNTYKSFYEISKVSYVLEGMPISCSNIGFEPLSLFDGIPESAWCEGVKGDGIGQWVEFELKDEVFGLAIYNGFRKVRWCRCLDSLGGFDEKEYLQLQAVYSNNNRVKLFEIVSTNGEIKQEIELDDTPLRQVVADLYLPKGVYRLYIRDIFKGTKWDDTCLGELEFFLASAKKLAEEDNFLKNILNP